MKSEKKQATRHPNKIPFSGVLTRVDVPSDVAPSGSRGHRVVLTREAAEEALDSLIGMAVGFKLEFDGHDARQKCGIIDDARIEGDELLVSGYLFGRDFPELAVQLKKPKAQMGMSYELADAHVEDMRCSIWRLTRVTFTGAAILFADKAAYRSSRFAIAASSEKFNHRLVMAGTVKIAR